MTPKEKATELENCQRGLIKEIGKHKLNIIEVIGVLDILKTDIMMNKIIRIDGKLNVKYTGREQ